MSTPPVRRITIGGVPSKIVSIPRRISLSFEYFLNDYFVVYSSSGLQAQQQSHQLQSLPSAQQQQQQPQLSANLFPDANASNDSFQNASLDRSVMLAAQPPQIAQQSQQMPPQQYQQFHAPLYHDNAEKLSKAYSLPPSMSAAAKESLRKELAQSRLEQQQQQQHARKFQPVARAFNVVTSSSTAGSPNSPSTTNVSSQGNTSNIYTDIALGKSIQNLMKPTPILATAVANRLAGGSLTRSIGSLGPCRELPEGQEATGYCRAASSLLGNFTGSNSVSACTATHPHRCVQDLIKEELGGSRLSKAGSMINMSTDSDLFSGGGSQSHPASGRSSPAFIHGTTPVGSPPRFLNTLGPSYSGGGGSARASRAPSPSVLHASAGGEHA
uniref:Uncharacterized protein n=1 Tax=Anopheles stephensi TaxID=30069 RepID=A0A182Y647_ANOST